MTGLAAIRDNFSNYLQVDAIVSQDQTPNSKYPAVIRFVVTNTSQHSEFETDVVFEEVQLKVGVAPNWHVQKAENLSGGQSFYYEHHCNYDDITRVQWTLEGRVSPAVLLTFHRMPSQINRNQQLPVSAYFDFLEQLKIHKWLEQIKSFPAPNQDTTLAEMKSKQLALSSMSTELSNSAQQLNDFLSLIDYRRSRDDILQHRNMVVEYLNRTQSDIGGLAQGLRQSDAQGFGRERDNVVVKLSRRATDLDKATEALTQKLGISAKGGTAETAGVAAPTKSPLPAIPLKEIDLHSNPNIEEAIPALELFIKQSYRENVRTIRVIHGKGIGVLRNAVRLHLESHKLIQSVNPADKDHGGDGATEANLVDYNPELT